MYDGVDKDVFIGDLQIIVIQLIVDKMLCFENGLFFEDIFNVKLFDFEFKNRLKE